MQSVWHNAELQPQIKWVWIPVTLLCLLLDKYHLEMYEPSHPHSPVSLGFVYKDDVKVDMALKKETKTNQIKRKRLGIKENEQIIHLRLVMLCLYWDCNIILYYDLPPENEAIHLIK